MGVNRKSNAERVKLVRDGQDGTRQIRVGRTRKLERERVAASCNWKKVAAPFCGTLCVGRDWELFSDCVRTHAAYRQISVSWEGIQFLDNCTTKKPVRAVRMQFSPRAQAGDTEYEAMVLLAPMDPRKTATLAYLNRSHNLTEVSGPRKRDMICLQCLQCFWCFHAIDLSICFRWPRVCVYVCVCVCVCVRVYCSSRNSSNYSLTTRVQSGQTLSSTFLLTRAANLRS